MGLSYAEAIRLGIGHLHPDAAARGDQAGRSRAVREDLILSPPPPPDGMNKTERRFMEEVLEPLLATRSIARYAFEPLKFRLAGRTFYTPDFLVSAAWGRRPAMVDVKGGYIREDASIKIKVAAAAFPEFRWMLACYSEGRTWRLYDVTDRGIAANPAPIAHIYGGS